MIILLITVVHYKPAVLEYISEFKAKHSKSASAASQGAIETSGFITIDYAEWHGPKGNYNPNLQIVGHLLTNDVFWMIRLDRDDSRVYTLYPRNWTAEQAKTAGFKGKTLDTNPALIVEWKVVSGQSIKKAEVNWELCPKGTY